MRKPAVAGAFYPRSEKNLRGALEDSFRGVERREMDVIAGIVPHAGYMYSGWVAAYVYSKLPPAETFIILGPNHRGVGSGVAVSQETWLTPLGEVLPDLDFIASFPRKIIDTDEDAHRMEHSIEVQLPFLQYLFKDFKLVAITMALQDEDTCRDVGSEIRTAIKKTGRKAIILASSDFTHYEPDSTARKTDKYVIDAILELDFLKFFRRVYEKNASVCGVGPIGSVLSVIREEASRGELVKYATSGDIIGDRSSVVGYAGIIFTR
jgi:hypothetical protein